MKAELLSIREYATYHNITEQAVYKKIKAGKLSTVTIRENGKPKQYIYIPEATAGADQAQATVPAADPVPAAAPRARAGNPSPLPDVSDPDAEAAAAAADPERISPRAFDNQASQQRPQEPAQNEITIKALINQLETKDRQIAELTEIISRFQELQAHNQMLLSQHATQATAAAAADPSEVVIAEQPAAEAAAGADQAQAPVPAADPEPRLSFRQRIRKMFFYE